MRNFFTRILLLLLLQLIAFNPLQAQVPTTYSTPGTFTYTVPVGVYAITVQLWGGGAIGTSISGGGGGAFTKSIPLSVTAGQVYTITVGYGQTLSQAASSSSFSLNGTILVIAYNGGGSSNTFGGSANTNPNNTQSYSGGCGVFNNPGGSGGGGSAGTLGNGYCGSGGIGGNTNGLGGNGGNANQQGFDPGGGGGSGYRSGGDGQVIITPCQAIGNITGHTVPWPGELATDSVYSVDPGGPLAGPYTWEKKSTANAVWTSTPGTTRSLFLSPVQQPDITYYRRKATSCTPNPYCDSVMIKTFWAGNGQLNGTIAGTVKSWNGAGPGAGVAGDSVAVQKTIVLRGSPISKIYYGVTNGSGAFSIQNIFYGDVTNGDPASVSFKVWPLKVDHDFHNDTVTVSLSNTNPTVANLEFIDYTVYPIMGAVTQTCTGCVTGFTTDSLNGVAVTVSKGTTNIAILNTGDNGNGRGKFNFTATEPGIYKLKPAYLNHQFNPVDSTVTVVNTGIGNVNFKDTSTRAVTVRFKAGCDESIGRVQLEFTDTVAGRPTPSFKMLVTTSVNGNDTAIRLPARKYKVRVISFTPNSVGADINPGDLLSFFNVAMYSNIDTANAALVLTYHRPPVLQIVNLPDTSCGNYVVFKQSKARSFAVNIFEGDPSHGCKVATDTNKVVLVTAVQGDDQNETLRYSQTNGVTNITLTPGMPNIVSPYFKYFNLAYTDKYGRAATPVSRNVVVLGVKSDPGTFTTVSPEVPLMILHDPPGDNSFSYWETNQTAETAMRFYGQKNTSGNAWGEVKVGVDLITGFGVSTETKVWGSINSNIGVSATVSDAKEAIVSVSNSQYYSTSGNSSIIGNGGDVYIGAALNLLYSVGHELKFISPCSLGIKNNLMIATKGFTTKYSYSEDHIVNNIVPTLQNFANNASGAAKANYLNQIKVWQQVIANNNYNKSRAAFDQNLSFDGAIGPITSSTSTTGTKTSTIEFGLEINSTTALELGFEAAGSGVSGGVVVGFKMETGQSETNTIIHQTTTGYTLDDDDNGDYFSVDIKKDPVYNTPVFVLVAGTASCPPEPVAQHRDACQLLVPEPVKTNIPVNGEALFQLHLGNTSESNETRTYNLSFVQASNPDGAIVTIGGSPVLLPIPYTIPYGQEVIVTVSVKKSAASTVFSYEGLQFELTDACDASVSKTNTIAAYFVSPCSGITLAAPGNNWTASSVNNNMIAIRFEGYSLPNLQSISLQHDTIGSGSWITDTTIYQALITDPTSTTFNWNIANIRDGAYDLRLKLACSGGTVFSQRVTGFIDRKAPALFGSPEPTDDNYVAGDRISFSYNELLNTNSLSNAQAELRRLSNNSIIPVEVSGFQNKVVIVPVVPITSFTGDTMRLVLTGVKDLYGNTKATPDTSYFTVGTTIPGTGPTAMNLASAKSSMLENAGDTVDIKFKLGDSSTAARTFNTLVNFSISGSAIYNQDYTVLFPSGQPISSNFNGSQGSIVIPSGSTSVTLKIKPIGEGQFEPNETINISLAEGGDYILGADITKADTIKNDDHSAPLVIANGPTQLCAGNTLTLSVANTIDGQPVTAYLWSDASTGPTLNVTTSGSYKVTVFTADGSAGVSLPLTVTVSAMPAPSLGADTVLYKNCYGETTDLLPLFSTTGLTATWNTATPTSVNPGIYRLVVANTAGCTDTAFANIILEVATWTGLINSDWSNPGNWNFNKVPSAVTHVIVPGGTPNNCIVNIPNALAASVQLRSGAVWTATTTGTITIGGKCLVLPPN